MFKRQIKVFYRFKWDFIIFTIYLIGIIPIMKFIIYISTVYNYEIPVLIKNIIFYSLMALVFGGVGQKYLEKSKEYEEELRVEEHKIKWKKNKKFKHSKRG